MLGFRRMGRFFTHEAVDRNDVGDEPETLEEEDGRMQHIQRCYLVRSVIDDLARADSRIREMVLEDRVGLEGPGCNAPVDHVVVHVDDHRKDVTDLDAPHTDAAVAQLLIDSQIRLDGQFALVDELKTARSVSTATR